MDEDYKCHECGFHTKYKRTLVGHISTGLCYRDNDAEREHLLSQLKRKVNESVSVNCEWCDKAISKTNISKHKKICKKKPEDKIQELQEQILRLEKQIKNVTTQNTVTNNTTQININNFIQLNSFGAEDIEHISQDFVKSCIMNNVTGMKNLIEKIHFSDEAPQNKNVKMKNIKEKLVYVNKDNQWVVKDAQEATCSMIRKGCCIANTCYNDENSGIRTVDENDLDNKIQLFLMELLGKQGHDYYALQRRIFALIIEYTS